MCRCIHSFALSQLQLSFVPDGFEIPTTAQQVLFLSVYESLEILYKHIVMNVAIEDMHRGARDIQSTRVFYCGIAVDKSAMPLG